MTKLALRLASIAVIFPGTVILTAFAQTKSSPPRIVAGIRNLSPAVYQADRQNWAVAEDNRGMLYFGNTTGVLEFDGTRWRHIPLPGGRGAFALAKSADGRILVGGQGEAGWLAPDESGSMVYVSQAAALPEAFRSDGEPILQILDTPAGQVFLSDHWLFTRSAEGALAVLRSGDHFMCAAWFEGALYVLDSGRGLMRLDNGALRNVAGGADLRGLTMLALPAGLLVPSYDRGIVLYSPASSNPWQTLHVNGWSAEENAGVTSALALNPSLLALGTAKHGVAIIDLHSGRVQRFGAAEGLADPHVYSLAYDHRGNLWLALAHGLSLVTLNLPRDPAARPFRAWVREVVATRDERLVFGGTFFANPGGIQQFAQGENQRPEFGFRRNAFRFSYSANGLDASGHLEFQTYMKGVDAEWSGWSDRTEREFTEIRPGQWTFRVRARNAKGEISEEGNFQIYIRPAWYNTWWFTVFEIVFVMGILLLPGHTPHKQLQETLTTFAAIVPCVFVGTWVGETISHYYASEVAFVNLLVSSLLTLAIDPIQTRLKRIVQHRNEKRALHRNLQAEHKRMLLERRDIERKHAEEEREFAEKEKEFAEEEQEYKEELGRERKEHEHPHKEHEHSNKGD